MGSACTNPARSSARSSVVGATSERAIAYVRSASSERAFKASAVCLVSCANAQRSSARSALVRRSGRRAVANHRRARAHHWQRRSSSNHRAYARRRDVDRCVRDGARVEHGVVRRACIVDRHVELSHVGHRGGRTRRRLRFDVRLGRGRRLRAITSFETAERTQRDERRTRELHERKTAALGLSRAPAERTASLVIANEARAHRTDDNGHGRDSVRSGSDVPAVRPERDRARRAGETKTAASVFRSLRRCFTAELCRRARD